MFGFIVFLIVGAIVLNVLVVRPMRRDRCFRETLMKALDYAYININANLDKNLDVILEEFDKGDYVLKKDINGLAMYFAMVGMTLAKNNGFTECLMERKDDIRESMINILIPVLKERNINIPVR